MAAPYALAVRLLAFGQYTALLIWAFPVEVKCRKAANVENMTIVDAFLSPKGDGRICLAIGHLGQ